MYETFDSFEVHGFYISGIAVTHGEYGTHEECFERL